MSHLRLQMVEGTRVQRRRQDRTLVLRQVLRQVRTLMALQTPRQTSRVVVLGTVVETTVGAVVARLHVLSMTRLQRRWHLLRPLRPALLQWDLQTRTNFLQKVPVVVVATVVVVFLGLHCWMQATASLLSVLCFLLHLVMQFSVVLHFLLHLFHTRYPLQTFLDLLTLT